MPEPDDGGGAADEPLEGTQTSTSSDIPTSSALPFLTAGTVFGPYRILGLLGRGGMGVVYEAEELETARRVALKVIGRALQGPRDRARFLREGRLAASINHPHCVYVFGATEIDGNPVIALEPMRGTLAQRLQRSGPMAPAAAVDAILQVVQGLEAAAEVDILHRDIKPSNCFLDEQDIVKVGDFGISRSAHAVGEAGLTVGKVIGTPAYASPEQLRGAALDLRSDLYSVGATLFELLTGRTPFAGRDVVSQLMAVASEPPPDAHTLNPAIPRGLSEVVRQCLAKRPDERFADYQQLAAALAPYASGAPTPAPLGRRFVAGAIDLAIVLATVVVISRILPALAREPNPLALLESPLAVLLIALVYFGLLETLRAATPGKALCGLAVRGTDGLPAGVSRILARATLFAVAVVVIRLAAGSQPLWLEQRLGGALAFLAVQIFALSWLVVLFGTARRHNGFSALHDLASGTRVVQGRERAVQRGRSSPPLNRPQAVAGRAGPYDVLAGTVQSFGENWRWGFDPVLLRPVWIRFSDSGSPPVSPARRELNRVTRLRWLAGQRLGENAWDAFEAVDGVPLAEASRVRRHWADVRWWLLDIARECAAMTPADRAPLNVQRVWVLASGRAKLLDDPIADIGTPADPASADRDLLIATARTALAPDPLPLGARRFLDGLYSSAGADIPAAVRELEALTRRRAVLTRGWRAMPLLVCSVAIVLPLAVVTLNHVVAADQRPAPLDERVAWVALTELALAEHGWIRMSPADRQAIEAALTTRYRDIVADGRLFQSGVERDPLAAERQAIARALLLRPPDPRGQTAGPIGTRLNDIVSRVSALDEVPWHQTFYERTFGLYGTAAILALILNFVFCGGFLRVMGLELLTADGRQASRLRVLVRTALTWSPILIAPLAMPFAERYMPDVAGTPWWALGMLIGAIAILLTPSRGLQDRIARTWVGPR